MVWLTLEKSTIGPPGKNPFTPMNVRHNRYQSWFCPIPQGAEDDRQSVNPAKMKLCSVFYNPFQSKQTILCSAAPFIPCKYLLTFLSTLWDPCSCMH